MQSRKSWPSWPWSTKITRLDDLTSLTRSITPDSTSFSVSFLTHALCAGGKGVGRYCTLHSLAKLMEKGQSTLPTSCYRHAILSSKRSRSLRRDPHSASGASPNVSPENRTHLSAAFSGVKWSSHTSNFIRSRFTSSGVGKSAHCSERPLKTLVLDHWRT